MPKPYTWQEVKTVLEKELKKTKHIMTFGTIGSCNIENDIDIIITKNPKKKASEFFKEVHELFFKIDHYLQKKYKTRAHRFWGLEEELKILSNYKSKDLIFQVMIYNSLPQMKKDWAWILEEGSSINTIIEDYDLLLGKKKDLFLKEFNKSNYSDPLFLFLNIHDRINSNYPEELLIKIMNKYFRFFYQKKLEIQTKKAKNKEEVKKIFYEICDLLEKKSK